MSQFENLRASSLYCNKCGKAMPVREMLLLVLPDKEIYDYLCTGCSSSLGSREVSAGDLRVAQAAGSTMKRRRSTGIPSSFGF
jgi:hypothetical protein